MRRILSALLVLLMLPSLSACAGAPSGGSGDSPQSPPLSPQADPSSTQSLSLKEEAQPAAAKIEKTAVQAQEPWYLPVDEVGAYNSEIITGEILDGCTLGEISADALPYWNGLIVENKAFCWTPMDDRWEEDTPGMTYFTEDQIRFQAEQGFNCVRVLYSFSFLSHPEDIHSINMAELEQLDEVLSWCMKYNLHMLLSVTGLPGMAGQGREKEDIVYNNALFFDEAMQKTFQEYWLMLARRYAGIPSGALSFELEAEGSCDGENGPDMQRYFDALSPIAYGIWEASPGRIVIVNDNGKEPPEQLAEIGCCLSLHTHVYNHCGAEEDWYGLTGVEHHWPMENIPRYFHGPENGTLKLVSENGFRAGSLTVGCVVYMFQPPEVRCDGTAVPAETVVNEKGATVLTAQIPDGTREIELAPAGRECNIELILVELNQEGRERVQLNVPLINYAEGQVFPTIQVGDDGTLTSLTGQLLLDGASIYGDHIKKFVECAQRNHVGFIETEIGTDTTVLSVEEYLAYHTMWLEMMREHNISWMYNCDHNIFAPKECVWLNGKNNPIPFERFSQWEDGPYWVNDDVMELLKGYTTAPVVENRLTVGDMPLCEFYRNDGQPKPLVILLHGGGGSKEETVPWARDLAEQGFYALAVDAAAHGESKLGPLDAVLCWSTTVTQLDAVIEHYAQVPQADAEHFGLAGSSMGGTTCFAYAAHGKYAPAVIAPSVGSADLTALPESPLYDRYGGGDSDEPGMSREEVMAYAEEYSPVNFPERFLDVYIYSQTGMEDPIGNPASVKPLEDALRELGGTKFVFEYYEGVGHEGSPDFDPNRALRQVLLGDRSDPVFD